MKINSATIAALSDNVREQWVVGAGHELHERFSAYYIALHVFPDDLIPLVEHVTAWAGRYEVTSKADVTRLNCVAASLGHRFWQDPRFRPYVSETIRNRDLLPSRRAAPLVRAARTWLSGLWSDDDLLSYANRLADHLLQTGGKDRLTALRLILPGHWRLFSSDDNQRLIAWLQQTAPETIGRNSPQMIAYVATALVHGTGWLGDPQYAYLAEIIQTVEDADALADRLLSIYTEACA